MSTATTPSKTSHSSTLSTSQLSLSKPQRESVITLLNEALTTGLDLYSQIKVAHWNVKGPQFYFLHTLFDELATELYAQMDDVAERAVALGGTAIGTVRQSARLSRLSELPITSDRETQEGLTVVSGLTEAYATYANLVLNWIDECDAHGDADTTDLFTGLSRLLDKRLWMLESHLK
ncbi:MAG: DNA starvation/stationary phase protection protein Dps [Vampirovibrionales bacterium]|nr:DNA starvation/stationary phase protection protein Dps [Vampirovibrionales bacterium]